MSLDNYEKHVENHKQYGNQMSTDSKKAELVYSDSCNWSYGFEAKLKDF